MRSQTIKITFYFRVRSVSRWDETYWSIVLLISRRKSNCIFHNSLKVMNLCLRKPYYQYTQFSSWEISAQKQRLEIWVIGIFQFIFMLCHRLYRMSLPRCNIKHRPMFVRPASFVSPLRLFMPICFARITEKTFRLCDILVFALLHVCIYAFWSQLQIEIYCLRFFVKNGFKNLCQSVIKVIVLYIKLNKDAYWSQCYLKCSIQS